MLWQLFVATSNYFSRTLDRDRLRAHDEVSLLGRIQASAGGRASTEEIERFLEGFPRRYLAMHSAEQIATHFGMYRKLSEEPVGTQVAATRHGFVLTLLTADRPALFATISGVLAGWGMNINKADAFANADRKSTRLNSSHSQISYAVFCLKKKKKNTTTLNTLR